MKTFKEYQLAVRQASASVQPQFKAEVIAAVEQITQKYAEMVKPEIDSLTSAAVASGVLKMPPATHPWAVNVRNDDGKLHFQAQPAYTKAPRIYNRAVIDMSGDPTVAYQIAQAIALGGNDALRDSFAGPNQKGAKPTPYLRCERVGAENKVTVPGVGEIDVPARLFEPLPFEIVADVDAPQPQQQTGAMLGHIAPLTVSSDDETAPFAAEYGDPNEQMAGTATTATGGAKPQTVDPLLAMTPKGEA